VVYKDNNRVAATLQVVLLLFEALDDYKQLLIVRFIAPLYISHLPRLISYKMLVLLLRRFNARVGLGNNPSKSKP